MSQMRALIFFSRAIFIITVTPMFGNSSAVRYDTIRKKLYKYVSASKKAMFIPKHMSSKWQEGKYKSKANILQEARCQLLRNKMKENHL